MSSEVRLAGSARSKKSQRFGPSRLGRDPGEDLLEDLGS